MRPTAARSNRSSSLHHSRLSPTPTPSTTSVCHQQQQQMLYAPISNLMMTLQPCGTALHSSCVYPNIQPHLALPNSVPLHHQGMKNYARQCSFQLRSFNFHTKINVLFFCVFFLCVFFLFCKIVLQTTKVAQSERYNINYKHYVYMCAQKSLNCYYVINE